jgi:hypothetical protein
MTTPVSDPLAPLSEDQIRILGELIVQYGSVQAIPPSVLSQAGISPAQANVEAGKIIFATPPNPAPTGPRLNLGPLNPLDGMPITNIPNLMPQRPAEPPTGGFGGGGSFDTRPFPAQVPGNTGKPSSDTIFGAVVNGDTIPAPRPPGFLDKIFGRIKSIPDYARASAAQAIDRPPSLADYLNGLGDSSEFQGVKSGGAGFGIPQPYQFHINDFTDEANMMAAKAYSPQYAALEQAKQQVNQNYDIASKIVDGLYDQATANITSNTNTLNQNYAKAQQQNTRSGQDLQSTIGNTYKQSQQQVTDLLKQLGAGPQAGAAILPQGAEDQAFQQSEAARLNKAQGDFLTSQQQGTQAYQTGTQQATQQEGNVQQQNLLGEKGNRLNELAQQKLNLSGQQSLQALGLADQLTQQDLGLQQLNYGAGQDYYRNAMAQQQSQSDAQQQALQNAIAQYGVDYQQYRDKINDQQQAAQLALNKYNIDTGNAIAQQNADTNSIQAQAQIQSSLQGKAQAEASDPNSQWTGQILQITGGDARMAAAIKQIVLAQAYNGQLPRDGQDFSKMVRAAAINAGLNPDMADAAASAYYYSAMCSQYPYGGPNGG